MLDDLLDAQAAVDWAVTQIPVLQERFLSWQRSGPYELVVEPDPDPRYERLVARQKLPLDPVIQAEVGSIINSIRSSLDLLAATLAARSGIKPSAHTHFPIFGSIQDMIDPLTGIESKKWFSQGERASIKALRPYEGGDAVLYPLHQLDIKRKHERLIVVRPEIQTAWIARGSNPIDEILSHPEGGLDDDTPLFRFRAHSGFRPTKGNTNIIPTIRFNEAALGMAYQPVIPTLRNFAERIGGIVRTFKS